MAKNNKAIDEKLLETLTKEKWVYGGDRHIKYSNGRDETLYVVSVPHPNGQWEAIFCKTEAYAKYIIELANKDVERINVTYSDGMGKG